MILVNIDANTSPSVAGGVGLYARVCCPEQRSDLERQTARLSAWAGKAGHKVVRMESEIASGMDGCRWKAQRLLADPKVTTVVVEHKDRLGRMNVVVCPPVRAGLGEGPRPQGPGGGGCR
ncbi:recombinase family protein [Actinopolymorpha pittospori]|uniref:Site-specific integrase-resolvase n=1 Tax=Actinopolymorpha pittospori TaxID=648752 RepID=A0A927R841_9ACTN|nr:putative site-specific integrase-resolvase [Actinopolymorpha pittospori]